MIPQIEPLIAGENEMIRRDAILSLLAAPVSWFWSFAGGSIADRPPRPTPVLHVPKRDDRWIFRLGSDGVELDDPEMDAIEWDEIKPGDVMLLFDYCGTRLTRITKRVAVSLPDHSQPGSPVQFQDDHAEIDCTTGVSPTEYETEYEAVERADDGVVIAWKTPSGRVIRLTDDQIAIVRSGGTVMANVSVSTG